MITGLIIGLAIVVAIVAALVHEVGHSKKRKWEDEKSGYDADQ